MAAATRAAQARSDAAISALQTGAESGQGGPGERDGAAAACQLEARGRREGASGVCGGACGGDGAGGSRGGEAARGGGEAGGGDGEGGERG